MKILIAILFLFSSTCFAKLKVVTTSTDLRAIVQAVGGDKVEVLAIAKGTQDQHQIEAKPSFMVKMRDADLILAHGLELESAWIVPLIHGARNPKIEVGSQGFYELGDKLDPIEIPKGAITRADGDVHPGGNPHFQLDPIRVGKAAVLIADKLSDLDPSNKNYYESNAKNFENEMEQKAKEWKARLAKTGIKEVVTYHKTFSYFCDRFQIECDLQLEPRPGIPPTASHLMEVIEQMKKRKIKMVLIENYYDDSISQKLKTEIPDAKIYRVAVSVDGDAHSKTNTALIENIVDTIEKGK